MAILSQIRIQVLTKGFGSYITIFAAELAVAGLDYDVFVCAESKVPDRYHLSELRVSGFGCPQQRLRNSTPGAQSMALYVWKNSASSGRASWGVLAMNPVCFVFAVG